MRCILNSFPTRLLRNKEDSFGIIGISIFFKAFAFVF